jgi:uncharacterized protein (DUF58 family)
MTKTSRVSRFLDPRLLASLASMEIRARSVVEGFVEGLHKSPIKGFNVEFSEYRQYVPGDPLKDIDWKVYARTDKYYIKEHEEETNLSGYLIIDASGSMSYRGDGAFTKLEYAATLAATLAYLMLRQQDSVGLVTFADGLRKIIRPRTGMAHLKALCTELENTVPEKTTDIGDTLDRVAEAMRKRGLLIVFSDLMDNAEVVIEKVRLLRTRKHEILLFHVLDRHELTFPFEDTTLFRDLEDRTELTADAYALRREYLQRVRQMVSTFQSALRKAGVDYLLADTSLPLETCLRSFFTRRQALPGRLA